MITIKKRKLTKLKIQPVIHFYCLMCGDRIEIIDMYDDLCYDCYALYKLSKKQGFIDEMDIDCKIKRTYSTNDLDIMEE